MSTYEEVCYELFVFEGALDEGDIFKGFNLLANGWCLLIDMSSDLVSTRLSMSPCLCLEIGKDDGGDCLPYCRGDTSKGSRLSACSIDDY